MTNPLIKHWQITFLVIVLLLSLTSIGMYGIKLGMDFKGGTMYQVELQKSVSAEEISRIANIISQRIDPSGLKDATVYPVGGQFIVVQLTETDPVELEKVEARIRQQGKFEATIVDSVTGEGEIIFTGDELTKVLRGDNSFGVYKAGNSYEWSLPFVLNEKASQSFKEKTFHQCNATDFSSTGAANYDCEKTVFFLDKPSAVVITSSDQYSSDEEIFKAGNRFENIPADTDVEKLIKDSMLQVIIVDNNILDENKIQSAFLLTKNAVVSPDIPKKIVDDLNSMGFIVSVVETKKDLPWLWTALGAKQIISLTPSITNEDVSDISQAKSFGTLRITGQRATLQEARADLEELAILLESGSLPTPVKSISKETISPSLGESFLSNVFLMGLIAAFIVASIIVIRYRNLKLAFPILITGFSELIIMGGFLTLIQRPVDLASFAGLIAAIGTGVDSEIVITDEILGKSKEAHESLLQRAKTAMFIIATSAFTVIGVMGPIVLFSRNLPGLDKLFGFAVVAIVGALIGILITRPAFTKIVEMIVNKKESEEHKRE